MSRLLRLNPWSRLRGGPRSSYPPVRAGALRTSSWLGRGCDRCQPAPPPPPPPFGLAPNPGRPPLPFEPYVGEVDCAGGGILTSASAARFDNPGRPGSGPSVFLVSSSFLFAPPHTRMVTPSLPSAFISNALASPMCHLSISCPPAGRARTQNRAVKSFEPEQSRWPRGWNAREKTASSCASTSDVTGSEGSGFVRE